MEATDKQLSLIERIELYVEDAWFEGETKREATEFISKHMEDYIRERDHAFSEIYNAKHY